MAGSLEHCLDEHGNYRGADLLENMGDMREAVDQMVFMLLHIKNRPASRMVSDAEAAYYRCLRGESPWPDYFKAGAET